MKSPKILQKKMIKAIGTNDRDDQKRKRFVQKTLSLLPDVPERIIYKFKLAKRDNKNLGITIVGGNDHSLNGIFIKSIAESSVCALDKNLLVGDQILMLNEHNFRNITHQQAVTCFKHCKSQMEIVVARMVETNQTGERPVSPFHARLLCSNSRSFSEEPEVLEHKGINRFSLA